MYYYFCDICNFNVIVTFYAPPLGSKFQEESTDLKASLNFFPFSHYPFRKCLRETIKRELLP